MTVTLHLGDCAQVLQTLPDDCIDLTVTSPPYDNLRTYKGYTFDFEPIARELYRVTKPGGVVVWVVDDRKQNGSESGTSLRQALYFMGLGFNLHDKMIYRKLNGAMGATNEYLQEFELMFVFSKGTPKTVNLLRDRKNNYTSRTTPKSKSDEKGSTVGNRHRIEVQDYGRRKNIWDYAVGGPQEYGNHPAVFPEALARDHILSWSNPGDTVMDCFLGSGTTGKMAVKYQRNFVGIEISAEYLAIAEKRIKAAQAQPQLWEAQP